MNQLFQFKMDDDSDSRPSFSASGNSQQLSNHGLEGDEYFEDPQNMYGEDIINEDHIIYGYVDNDDDYPEYAHLIDEVSQAFSIYKN